MTRQNFTRWTCNVCKAETETSTDTQPQLWAGYGFTETSVPAGQMLDLGHLCGDCLDRVYAAMEAPPATPSKASR